MSHRSFCAAALALALASPGAARAQSWESPAFFAPRPGDDVGIHAIDAKGADLGLMAIWRQAGAINLGVRAGLGGRSGDRTILLGGELSGLLLEPEPGRALAAAWLVGAGASFDGTTWLRIPVGVSVGARLGAAGFAVTPYAHPRVSLDYVAHERIDDVETTSTEINIDVDLGAELEAGARWLIRAAVTLGDQEAFGFGLAYRIPRRIAVR
jgi:hypothetical protein